MDSKQRGIDEGMRVYNEFEPTWDWVPEEDCDTLLVYLPGFKKEQLRVQLTRTRNLIISGERQIENNTWSRFRKQFAVSNNCDVNGISARFDAGILYVRQPKLIMPVEKHDELGKPTINTEPPKVHKPLEEPQPQNNTKEQAAPTAAPAEPTNEKKKDELQDDKSVLKKGQGMEMGKKNGKEESDSMDSKKAKVREETESKSVDEKNLKKENASDHKRRSDGGSVINNGDESGKSRVESYKRAAVGGVAIEVKSWWKVMNMALAVIMVIVLGMYIVKAIRSPVKQEY